MDIRKVGCEAKVGMELADGRVRWSTLVLETPKLHAAL